MLALFRFNSNGPPLGLKPEKQNATKKYKKNPNVHVMEEFTR